MLVKVTKNGVSRFISESNVEELKKFSKAVGAVIETNEDGSVKLYSTEEFKKVAGLGVGEHSLEAILGLPEKTKKSAPTKIVAE